MDEILGEAECDITRKKNQNTADSHMSNFITDAIREKYDSDVVIYNAA